MGPLANSRRRLAAMADLVRGCRCPRRDGSPPAASRVGNRGWFYAPTVLADVPLDARVMSEEPFGPIAPCTAVGFHGRSLEDQQQPQHGACSLRLHQLTAERADYLSRELAGGIGRAQRVHQPGRRTRPLAAYRESGIGREGGTEMYHSYTVAKTIAERRVQV